MTTAVAALNASDFAETFSDEEFDVSHGIPLIDEHQPGPDSDGNPRPYIGREELQAVVDANNERIADTGDFAAISLRHTPTLDDIARGATAGPVVGFAGPFRLQKIGRVKPRWAIVAENWATRKDYRKDVKDHPRRSIELWFSRATGKPKFFDPIALLGAETPERALGLKLSAAEANKSESADLVCERYEMDKSKQSKSEGENKGQPTAKPAATDPNENPSNNGDPLAENSNQQNNSLTGDDALVAKMLYALEKTDVFTWARQQMASGAASAAAGALGGNDPNANPMDAGGNPAGDKNNNPAAGDPTANNQEGEGMPADNIPATDPKAAAANKPPKDEKEQYAKAMHELGEYRELYKKEKEEREGLQATVASLNERLAKIEAEKVEVERYQALRDMADKGYVLDLEEERKVVSEMSAVECDRYMKGLERNCKRVPIGVRLPEGVERENYKKGSAEEAREVKRQETLELARREKLDYAEACRRTGYQPTA